MTFRYKSVAVEQTGENIWRTTKPVVYRYPFLINISIPEGYRTDFATIPRLLWSLCPRYGLYTAATIVHDYAITDLLPKGRLTSRQVDMIFREAMRDLGVSFPRRWLMWAGVRWGAIGNRKRRSGSLGTLPGVLLVSLLALPLVLPAVALLPSLVVLWVGDKFKG